MNEVEKIIRKYLEISRMMQLATVSGKQPWCCTVYFVPDENLNLYWISKPDRRHSKEIFKNKRVSITIPIKHIPGKAVVGISLEGDAFEIKDKREILKATGLYRDRYNTGEKWYKEFLEGKNPHKLYRITPRLFVLFDEESYPKSPRNEWKIK